MLSGLYGLIQCVHECKHNKQLDFLHLMDEVLNEDWAQGTYMTLPTYCSFLCLGIRKVKPICVVNMPVWLVETSLEVWLMIDSLLGENK